MNLRSNHWEWKSGTRFLPLQSEGVFPPGTGVNHQLAAIIGEKHNA